MAPVFGQCANQRHGISGWQITHPSADATQVQATRSWHQRWPIFIESSASTSQHEIITYANAGSGRRFDAADRQRQLAAAKLLLIADVPVGCVVAICRQQDQTVTQPGHSVLCRSARCRRPIQSVYVSLARIPKSPNKERPVAIAFFSQPHTVTHNIRSAGHSRGLRVSFRRLEVLRKHH